MQVLKNLTRGGKKYKYIVYEWYYDKLGNLSETLLIFRSKISAKKEAVEGYDYARRRRGGCDAIDNANGIMFMSAGKPTYEVALSVIEKVREIANRTRGNHVFFRP